MMYNQVFIMVMYEEPRELRLLYAEVVYIHSRGAELESSNTVANPLSYIHRIQKLAYIWLISEANRLPQVHCRYLQPAEIRYVFTERRTEKYIRIFCAEWRGLKPLWNLSRESAAFTGS